MPMCKCVILLQNVITFNLHVNDNPQLNMLRPRNWKTHCVYIDFSIPLMIPFFFLFFKHPVFCLGM